jgi:hypothetical protein
MVRLTAGCFLGLGRVVKQKIDLWLGSVETLFTRPYGDQFFAASNRWKANSEGCHFFAVTEAAITSSYFPVGFSASIPVSVP